MTDRVLFINAMLVNEGREWPGCLRIQGDRIEAVAPSLEPLPDERVIDLQGAWLLPGMIDDQVHFREPGLEYKADIASESAACVAGGITSFMDMPNTNPPTLSNEALEDKLQRANGRARANYAFYFGAANDNLDAVRNINPLRTPGVKVFMGASTGNMLVDDPEVLDGIFAGAPVPIITHCEDTPTIDANMVHFQQEFGANLTAMQHPDIRSREACLKSSVLATELAKRHDARLHVLHISTAEELDLFEPGPLIRADGSRKRITAETCVHFLHFARPDYANLGNLIKCNPAIKDESDRAALIRAIATDRIDVLATDHAPHTLEEKNKPYAQAPSGLPLVQFALQTALDLVLSGQLRVEQVVQKVSHAPAQLFDVKERGFLRPGYFADLAIVRREPHRVTRDEILSKVKWSPFEGHTFGTTIAATWVNGTEVWRDGQLGDAIVGRALEFDR
ncbi:dihydroorotase [Luteimonas sp. FXH3W]|uniref:Dihydroorotase n=1 Tax=Aquilutibacter rugosus TaxID=3115820 RepID=A0ABU7V0E1_9GAMM